MTLNALTPGDVLVAFCLVVAAAGVSLVLQAGVAGRLFWASLRCVLQLVMVGFVLERVMGIHSPLPVVVWLSLMLFFAGSEAARRMKLSYPGARLDAWITMGFSAFVVGAVVTKGALGVVPWYNARYVIPLLGMIFGNSLNGISLGLDRFTGYIKERAGELELIASYGGLRKEVLRGPVKEAVRSGMIPIINSMSVVGIVSLPGMMTGHVLAGTPPLQAVAYQLVVMFMLAGANAIGTMVAAFLAGRRLVSPTVTLRLDILGQT